MWDLEAGKVSCSFYNAGESWKLCFKCGLLWPHGEISLHTFHQLFTPFAKRLKTAKQRIHSGSCLPDREASSTLYSDPEALALINYFRLREAMQLAFHWFVKHSSRLPEGIGILINTFEELAGKQIKALRDGKVDPTDARQMPQIYPVGLLISSSLVEYEENCLKWLEKQAPSLVRRSFQ